MGGAQNSEETVKQDEVRRMRSEQSSTRQDNTEQCDRGKSDASYANLVDHHSNERHRHSSEDVRDCDGGRQNASLPTEFGTDGLEKNPEGEEQNRTVADDQSQSGTENDPPCASKGAASLGH